MIVIDPNEKDLSAKIDELVRELNRLTVLYDAGTPEVSDEEWDDMYFNLMEVEERHPELIRADSPTQHISYTLVSELQKVQHQGEPMLSLDKTKSVDDIVPKVGAEWIATMKLDGLSCRLTYLNGKLIRAETRGNGYEGEDITHNAKVVANIPKFIHYKEPLVVDGEIICTYDAFEPFKEQYSNPRNFAAGSIRLLDSRECAKRNLSFIAWDVIGTIKNYMGNVCETLADKLSALAGLRFFTTTYCLPLLCGPEDAIQHLQITAKAWHYPIDGVVFKTNNCNDYAKAGKTAHHPSAAIAYKFYDEEYETILLDIEWSMGKTGVLSPVAVYQEIDIDGAKCNRANLHNVSIMQNLLGDIPHRGRHIWVYRANQIIPQVSHADLDGDGEPLLMPTHCPICQGATTLKQSDSGTVELYCENEKCEGRLLNKLEHFCGKKGLDIKGLSEATLEKLIEWDWVDSIADLFTLSSHAAEWIMKPGFGAKSVGNILAAIEKARVCELSSFISALSIPNIGSTYAKELAHEFINYWTLREAIASGCDFTHLEGFGPEKHDAIVNFDYAEADALVTANIIAFKKSATEVKGGVLAGITVVVTGKLHIWKNRDALIADIEARGGKVTSAVSSKTNYLINNDVDSTSSKNKKAKELGVTILTESEFAELFEI